jgi:predicted negative regulator of RcsB-dependent stress response
MALGTVKNTYVNKNDAPIVALLAIRLAKLQQQSDGMAS